MEKSSDDKEYYKEYGYTPPTREAVVRSMNSDGLYIGRCKKCKQKIRGRNLEELNNHKCDG